MTFTVWHKVEQNKLPHWKMNVGGFSVSLIPSHVYLYVYVCIVWCNMNKMVNYLFQVQKNILSMKSLLSCMAIDRLGWVRGWTQDCNKMLARSKILHLLIKKMMEIMIQSSKVVYNWIERYSSTYSISRYYILLFVIILCEAELF